MISNLYFKRLTGTPSHVFVGDLAPVTPARSAHGSPGWQISLPLNYEIGLEITPHYATWSLTHGDWNSYCVTDAGGTTEPAYSELGMGLNETACMNAANAGGFGFVNFWTSDGRCRGLVVCPYQFNCTARGCGSYDLGVKTYTLGLVHPWQNILRFTATDHDQGNQGDRIPGVWFYPNTTRLHIVDGHGPDANDECSILEELPAGVPTMLRIVLESHQVRVFYNGTLKCIEARSDRQVWNETMVYLGDPWYEPAPVDVRNFYLSELETCNGNGAGLADGRCACDAGFVGESCSYSWGGVCQSDSGFGMADSGSAVKIWPAGGGKYAAFKFNGGFRGQCRDPAPSAALSFEEMYRARKFSTTHADGTTMLPAGRVAAWGVGQPGIYTGPATPRCTATNVSSGSSWMAVPCSDEAVVKGFVIEYTEPFRFSNANSTYEVQSQVLYWAPSLQIAAAQQYDGLPGHLATIESADEAAFIQHSLAAMNLRELLWLGGAAESLGMWSWGVGPSAGAPFGYTNWSAGGEPVDAEAAALALWTDGGWASRPGGNAYMSIVEFERVSADLILELDAALYQGTGDWIDVTGNGHNASLTARTGHPTFFNTATRTFEFDGYSLASVNVDMGPTTYPALSIEVWFKLDPDADLDRTNGWIVGHDDGGFDRAIVISDPRFGGIGSGVGFTYDAGLGYPGRGEWHQIIAVFDQGATDGSFVALDGVIGTRVTARNDVSAESSFSIGGLARYAPTSHSIDGSVSMVRMYSKAMSSTEVAEAYRVFQEREPVPTTEAPIDNPSIGTEVVADLRRDIDALTIGATVPASTYQFPDSSEIGLWSLWSGRWNAPNATVMGIRPLGYAPERVHPVVDGGAFLDTDATNAYKLPGVRNGQLIDGDDEGAPDLTEVAVHPGNPASDPENKDLIITWQCGVSEWYDVSGSIRDLGLLNDGIVVIVTWMMPSGWRHVENLGLIRRDLMAFNYRVWLGSGAQVTVVIQPNANFYSDMAALSLSIRPAVDLSPFSFVSSDADCVTQDLGHPVIDRATPDRAANIAFVDTSVCFSSPGWVTALDLFAARTDQAGKVFQIYRFVENRGAEHVWQLVAESDLINVTELGDIHQEFDRPLTVQEGDCVGWRHTGQGVVDFDYGGSEVRWHYGSEPRVGGTIDFDGHGARTYSYTVEFTPNDCPDPHAPDAGTGSGWVLGSMQPVANIDQAGGLLSSAGHLVEYVRDVPRGASASRSIQLTKSIDPSAPAGAFIGGQVAVECGDVLQWSAWIKVVNSGSLSLNSPEAALSGLFGPDPASIVDGGLQGSTSGEWRWMSGAWTAQSPQQGSFGFTVDAAPAGFTVLIADLSITKVLQESEANLGRENTRINVTPSGFYVGGMNENKNLTTPYINPQSTMTSVFSDDVPEFASDPRSIEFSVLRSGAFAWCGFNVQVCPGDRMRFSLWLKFIDTVPTYDYRQEGGGGVGLKHHAGIADSEGDSQIYSDFLRTMRPNEWKFVSMTWAANYSAQDLMILILDSAPAGTRGRFCDMRASKMTLEPVLFFRGSGDYVSFANTEVTSVVPAGDSPYTIEAWVRPHTHAVNGIIGWGNWGTGNQVTALRLGAGGEIRHYWVGNDLVYQRDDLDDDRWHHIAATYNGTGSARILFVNGVEVTSDRPSPHAAVAADFRIGSTNRGEYFDGGIAEVRLWEVARTGQQISEAMQIEIDANAEEGLVGYWRMNDGGTTVRDSSPSGNNGQLIGGLHYNSHHDLPPITRALDDLVVGVADGPEQGVLVEGRWGELDSGTILQDGNTAKGYRLVRFELQVPVAAAYTVSIRYSVGANRASAVPVTIAHRSGVSVVNVDETQAMSAGDWQPLGTYRFNAGPAFIVVSNNATTGYVTIGSVKLSPAARTDPTPAGWNQGCVTASTHFNSGVFSYTVFPDPLPHMAVTFSVRGSNDAHVGFFEGPNENSSMYEVVIGGWSNSQSVIRRGPQAANEVEVATQGVLNADEWRPFWLVFDGEAVVIGHGLEVAAAGTEFMRFTDPTPKAVRYVGVGSGFGSGALWDLCAITDGSAGGANSSCASGKFLLSSSPPTCRPVRTCRPGQFESVAPTATSNRRCMACPAGESDVDSNWQTPCVPCGAGHYAPRESSGPCSPEFRCPSGTADTDRRAATPCEACQNGTTFTSTTGRIGPCNTVTPACSTGAEETATPTASSDRLCTACPLGISFSNVAGHPCTAITLCRAGQREITAPTTTSDRVCDTDTSNCTAGHEIFQSQCRECLAGTTDADYDAETPCIACAAGTHLARTMSTGPCNDFLCDPGTADFDQDPATACSACTLGHTYASGFGNTMCRSVGPACSQGQEEDPAWAENNRKDGAVSARPCVICSAGVTFKPQRGSGRCWPTLQCQVGEEETRAATIIADRVCQACRRGTFSVEPGRPCQAWQRCTPQEYQSVQPTASSDRVCVPSTTQAPGDCTSTQWDRSTLVDVWVRCLHLPGGTGTGTSISAAAHRIGMETVGDVVDSAGAGTLSRWQQEAGYSSTSARRIRIAADQLLEAFPPNTRFTRQPPVSTTRPSPTGSTTWPAAGGSSSTPADSGGGGGGTTRRHGHRSTTMASSDTGKSTGEADGPGTNDTGLIAALAVGSLMAIGALIVVVRRFAFMKGLRGNVHTTYNKMYSNPAGHGTDDAGEIAEYNDLEDAADDDDLLGGQGSTSELRLMSE